MKIRLAVLLLIPACLFGFIGGAVRAPEETTPTTEATKETVLVTIEPTVGTTAPATEPIIQETIVAPTERPETMPHETAPPEIVPDVTEQEVIVPDVTEPVEDEPTKDPEEPDDKPRSLGAFKLTAYCSCQKCCGSYALNRPVDENGEEIVYGSTGVRLKAGVSIAVDPRVISYGTQVIINGHTYIAHDTGGGIKGNRIDVYFDSHQDALNFGIQYAEVFVCE